MTDEKKPPQGAVDEVAAYRRAVDSDLLTGGNPAWALFGTDFDQEVLCVRCQHVEHVNGVGFYLGCGCKALLQLIRQKFMQFAKWLATFTRISGQ